MITSAPTERQLARWKELWITHKDFLVPDRKSGQQLIDYLTALYPLEETSDADILDTVRENITANSFFADKLPEGRKPEPRAFYVLDECNGSQLYKCRSDIFAEVKRIIVGVDIVSGCYIVEGSEDLWDELCAFQGLDEADLGNYVRTGQYLECRADVRRVIGRTVDVTVDRPLGSAHPRHPEMIYPVNYGYVDGVLAPDGAWQDAYVLGVDCPLDSFSGKVIAVIVRNDDVEDKWVVAPEYSSFSSEEIAAQVRFQEQFFKSSVLM